MVLKSPLPLLVAAMLILSGCVTHITSNVYQNPAPSEKFSNFTSIEVLPIKLVAPYADQESNEAALLKIQENVDFKLKPALAEWNARPATGASRTLLIEPTISEIKFINGSARFWSGAMAGSSAVKLSARITDKTTGQVIATPE